MQITEDKRRNNLLIGLSGSVASIKIDQLIQSLLNTQKFNIKIIVTQNAKRFFQYQVFKQKYSKNIQVYQDSDQYSMWKKRGDPVLHIQLRKWADIFLIAPLSANTLAKFNAGLSDNLVTLVFRCWNMTLNEQKLLINPVVICPAMNNLMYQHPITKQHLQKMIKFGCIVIDSIQKILMCGQKGKGAMEQIIKIVQKIIQINIKILERRNNMKVLNQQK